MGPTEFIVALRKGKTAPVYFLRGPDRFLHEVCRQALLDSVPAEVRDWCIARIEFEPGRLQKELRTADQMPMLGGQSYLLISDAEDFKHSSDEDCQALEAYLEHPSSFATVVFAAAEPDRRRRFIQLLEKKAAVVEMRPLGRQEAATWAEHFLHQAGVEVDPELAREIATKFENTSDREPERAGVNLLRMRTELEKLLTAKFGAKRLERADLELMLAFREEHQISVFLQAFAERNCGEAVERLRALLASKTAETLLLWCIADLLRQALQVQPHSGTVGRRGPMTYGGSWRGRSSRPGNPFSTWEIAASAAGRYSRQELLQALRLAQRADLGIKSSWKDARILLEFLVWQIVVGKGSESGSAWRQEISPPTSEA